MFRQRLATMGVALLGLLVTVVPSRADEASTLSKISELGGRFERDEQRPGRPVTAVDLSFTQAKDENLRALHDLPDLESLTIDKSSYPVAKGKRITYTQITVAGLKELKPLRNLKSLNLRGNHITDACLKELKELATLQSVNLSRTSVTGTGLSELKELRNLRSLGLGSSTTDGGWNALQELTSLQALTLIDMQLTASSLEKLMAMHGLQSVEFRDTPISEVALKRLRAALPEIKISFSARQLSRDEEIYNRTGK